MFVMFTIIVVLVLFVSEKQFDLLYGMYLFLAVVFALYLKLTGRM